MKKIVYTITVGICYLITVGYYSGASHQGYELTGAENGGGNLTSAGCSCHSEFAAKEINLSIELDSAGIPASHYIGGMDYTVTIKGINNDTLKLPKFGFQIGSIIGATPTAAPTNAGTWSTPYPVNTHFSAPQATNFYVSIIEQSIALSATTGNGSKGSTYVQTFNWKAPVAGTGTVSIWAVLNAINNDGSADPGDKWDTSHVVLNEWGTSSVNVPVNKSNEFSVSVFPNPATEVINITASKNANIQLINFAGTIILTSSINANQQQTISTENIANGIYTLKAFNANFTTVEKVMVAK